MKCGERPVERPTRSKRQWHGGIYVLNARLPAGDSVNSFAPQCGLQPIREMAGALAMQFDGVFAKRGIELHRLVYRPARSSDTANHFYQRQNVRWVEGMTNEQAIGEIEIRLQL